MPSNTDKQELRPLDIANRIIDICASGERVNPQEFIALGASLASYVREMHGGAFTTIDTPSFEAFLRMQDRYLALRRVFYAHAGAVELKPFKDGVAINESVCDMSEADAYTLLEIGLDRIIAMDADDDDANPAPGTIIH